MNCIVRPFLTKGGEKGRKGRRGGREGERAGKLLALKIKTFSVSRENITEARSQDTTLGTADSSFYSGKEAKQKKDMTW